MRILFLLTLSIVFVSCNGTDIEVDLDSSFSISSNFTKLSATEVVFFYWLDSGTLKASYFTRVGNVLTQEDDVTLWAVDAVYPFEWRVYSTALSSSSFVVSWVSSSTCVAVIEGSISGGNLSIDKSCVAFSEHDSGMKWVHWMMGSAASTEWLQIFGDNLAGSASTGFIFSTNQITDAVRNSY